MSDLPTATRRAELRQWAMTDMPHDRVIGLHPQELLALLDATEPVQRIEALIEHLECAVMLKAAAQLRADHPAEGDGLQRETRHLTSDEQLVLARALRRSVTILPEAPAEQGGGGATAAASRPSFEAQAVAVERALDEARSDVATFDQDDTQSDEIAALSAAAATLAAVPGVMSAAEALLNTRAPDQPFGWGFAEAEALRAALRVLAGDTKGK